MQALRLLMIAALLLVASLSAGQQRFVDPVETQCQDCHGPGLWQPPMNPIYDIFPIKATALAGEEFEFQAQLLNTWRAEELDMYVTLDIGRAPSLRFVGGQEPVGPLSEAGTIVIQPGPPTGTGTFLTQPHRAAVGFEVPTGATDLRFRLIPDETDANVGPDLSFRVFDAFTDHPSGQPVVIDAAGRGGTEVFHRQGAAAVAQHGYGNWTLEAEVTPARASPTSPDPLVVDPQVNQVGFTVTMEAWFNTTEEVQQVVTKPGPVQPGSREIFMWRLNLVQAPGEGEEIKVYANATTYFDHPNNEPDWENMTINKTAPLTVGDNGAASMGFDIQGGTINTGTITGVSMAAISEAIGYAAAMLLITSIWTGGIFGKASRRQLNTVFGSARRRVAFHNFLSYGIIVAAIAHLVIFVWDTIEPNYPWQLGLIWGSLGTLALLALGVTGALQVPMIRRWNYATWRWTHFALAIGSIVFTIVHMLLDGTHFGDFQDWIGWHDPIVPDDRQV